MSSAHAITKPLNCSALPCSFPSVSTLEGAYLCVTHFIWTCFCRLRGYAELQKQGRLSLMERQPVRQFIRESIREADRLEQSCNGHHRGTQRAQLRDIILWASELAGRIRRSQRKEVRIPVRLSVEMPGRPWEIDAETKFISRHGARLRLDHPLPVNETILVRLPGNGRQARARVAWYQTKTNGQLEVGIEFFGSPDFWNVNWDE